MNYPLNNNGPSRLNYVVPGLIIVLLVVWIVLGIIEWIA